MKPTNIDNKIISIINISSQYPSIKRMGVFGSCARGNNNTDSDIDILYDYDDLMINDTIKCLATIQKTIDSKIDFVDYNDLIDINDDYDITFKDNVLKDVIWIYEK